MTDKKIANFWDVFNYYLRIWNCEHTAYNVTKNELGYEPPNESY